MNQQYGYPPPHPQRSPGASAPGSGSFPDRRPIQPPFITTNIARTFAGSSQTPISATTFRAGGHYGLSPNSPAPYSGVSPRTLVPPPPQASSPRSPNMEPYNPQQWRGQVSGSQMVFQQRANAGPPSTREVTGMEGQMPSPPPPYSPETPDAGVTAARASPMPMVDTGGYTASPIQTQAPVFQSPPSQMSSAFPPPPSSSSRLRERSASSNQRSFFSLSGLRGKQPANVDLQSSHTYQVPDNMEPRPPAARRAASTGHLQSSAALVAQAHAQDSGAARRGSPDNTWQPGMPLPGPPPGPPPPGARSQSLNRYAPTSSRSNSITSERSIDAPAPRRTTAAAGSSLGPIPPTPADWVDPDAVQSQQVISSHPMSAEPRDVDYQPLRIDTGTGSDHALSRRPAKRDGSAQGIRERRSRSRADRSSRIFSPAEDSKPSDLVFSTADGSISRRREHMRTISAVVDPNIDSSSGSSGATRRAPGAANSVLTPPYTPAVGRSSDDLSRKQPSKVPGSASGDRPNSNLLHQPVDDSAMSAGPTPSRPASSGSAKPSAKLDGFALQAIERHRAFVEKEAAASSDEERLELFATFLVHESRLRRDRYSAAYNAMAGDIMDLTRDMWRSYTKGGKRAATSSTSMSSFDPTVPSWASASDGQLASAQGNMPSSASSYGDYTPGTDASSMNDFDGTGMERSDSRQWGETFKPSLSPIPSMAVSTVPDEDSSRGRTAARWWEQSNSGSGSIGKPDRIQKTLRETKYMGINPAMLQDIDQPSPHSSRHTGSTPGPSTQTFVYGANEYAPEKVGWHENADFETPVPTPAHVRKSSTPGGISVDVSRLVTLPPPYPRHHPAINNSHPLLTDLRSEHRELADRSKIQEIRDAYLDQDFAIQREQQEAAKERRAKLRNSIQGKIANGSISFADAAQAEADFDHEEADRGKAAARSNFDVFETSLAQPLNALLTERLQKADACIKQLRAELQHRNESSDPNQAQEEGDEEPERLEKLTLLKWIFEARELLHKEMFDFHADRAAKYSEVILTPYRIAKLQAKVDEATAFFTKDSQERQTNFSKDAVKRFEELQGIMELNVSRGVEDQLSAFWDIAPGLLELIQHLPSNPAELDIQIPVQEYEENPAYQDHPLQYLYSLLSHAQKSAYQFIESQTNLLCLLHEVRTATTKASLKVLEIERAAANPGDESVITEMEGAMVVQEERLTEDLKEKVGEVERQWNEALGEGLEDCRDRVRAFLEESGGWEDGLEG